MPGRRVLPTYYNDIYIVSNLKIITVPETRQICFQAILSTGYSFVFIRLGSSRDLARSRLHRRGNQGE